MTRNDALKLLTGAGVSAVVAASALKAWRRREESEAHPYFGSFLSSTVGDSSAFLLSETPVPNRIRFHRQRVVFHTETFERIEPAPSGQIPFFRAPMFRSDAGWQDPILVPARQVYASHAAVVIGSSYLAATGIDLDWELFSSYSVMLYSSDNLIKYGGQWEMLVDERGEVVSPAGESIGDRDFGFYYPRVYTNPIWALAPSSS